jgi:polysaccharide biosynthesis/export protein
MEMMSQAQYPRDSVKEMDMKPRHLLGLAFVVVVGLFLTGCTGPDIQGFNRRLGENLELVEKKEPDAEYIVDQPDSIRIEFINDPSNTRDVTLRSDGKVTLPLINDIELAGLTSMQIRDKLLKKYSQYYTDPKILVTVTGFHSKHIYVYGEVGGRRGAIPYTGKLTVSDVIGQVGGFTNRAAPDKVRVIRRDPKNPEVFRVDLKALIYEGDITQEVRLAENDVIVIPPNWLAKIGYTFESLLFPFGGFMSTASSTASMGSLGSGY